MESLDEAFERVCQTPSDINEHCPMLRQLAREHKHCTEFGVRYGTSTIALLAGLPRVLHSYDIRQQFDLSLFRSWAGTNTDFQFFEQSTLSACIHYTELLFIDTLHTKDQLAQELNRHAGMVASAIALHDTKTFGRIGEDGRPGGLMDAVEEFLTKHPEWFVSMTTEANNGFTILRRRRVLA